MPLTISAVVKLVPKLASLLLALSQESPLQKIAKNEYLMAIHDLNMVSEESNVREGLNRALTHLESAYIHYLPCITTWDVWTQYLALHSKRTFANTLCIYISIIHYLLGNISLSKMWLLEHLDTDGGIYFPTETLPALGLQDEKSFYQEVCGINYSKLERMIRGSKSKYKYESEKYDPDNWGGYGPGCGGLYSG